MKDRFPIIAPYPVQEQDLRTVDIGLMKAESELRAASISRLALGIMRAMNTRLEAFLAGHLDKTQTHDLCYYPEEGTPYTFAFAYSQVVALLPKERPAISREDAKRLHPHVILRWELRPIGITENQQT